jgi:hypothetical protein
VRSNTDIHLVDLGHDLQRLRHADAKEDLTGLGDLADLTVPAQHQPVHRRRDGVVGELLHLHRYQGLDLAQVHGDPLLRLYGGGAPAQQLRHALRLALGELFARPQFLELRARLPIVEPREHITPGNRLALAIANLDDAIAHQARNLGPAYRFDRARGIHDLDSRAVRCRHGGNIGTPGQTPPPEPSRQNEQYARYRKRPRSYELGRPHEARLPQRAGLIGAPAIEPFLHTLGPGRVANAKEYHDETALS